MERVEFLLWRARCPDGFCEPPRLRLSVVVSEVGGQVTCREAHQAQEEHDGDQHSPAQPARPQFPGLGLLTRHAALPPECSGARRRSATGRFRNPKSEMPHAQCIAVGFGSRMRKPPTGLLLLAGAQVRGDRLDKPGGLPPRVAGLGRLDRVRKAVVGGLTGIEGSVQMT